MQCEKKIYAAESKLRLKPTEIKSQQKPWCSTVELGIPPPRKYGRMTKKLRCVYRHFNIQWSAVAEAHAVLLRHAFYFRITCISADGSETADGVTPHGCHVKYIIDPKSK